MGGWHAEVPSPGVAAFIGLAAKAKLEADLEPLSVLRAFGYARRKKVLDACVCDVVNEIGDTGSTRSGLMPPRKQETLSFIDFRLGPSYRS